MKTKLFFLLTIFFSISTAYTQSVLNRLEKSKYELENDLLTINNRLKEVNNQSDYLKNKKIEIFELIQEHNRLINIIKKSNFYKKLQEDTQQLSLLKKNLKRIDKYLDKVNKDNLKFKSKNNKVEDVILNLYLTKYNERVITENSTDDLINLSKKSRKKLSKVFKVNKQIIEDFKSIDTIDYFVMSPLLVMNYKTDLNTKPPIYSNTTPAIMNSDNYDWDMLITDFVETIADTAIRGQLDFTIGLIIHNKAKNDTIDEIMSFKGFVKSGSAEYRLSTKGKKHIDTLLKEKIETKLVKMQSIMTKDAFSDYKLSVEVNTVIEGYADSSPWKMGNSEYWNTVLSKNRATAVKNYLSPLLHQLKQNYPVLNLTVNQIYPKGMGHKLPPKLTQTEAQKKEGLPDDRRRICIFKINFLHTLEKK